MLYFALFMSSDSRLLPQNVTFRSAIFERQLRLANKLTLGIKAKYATVFIKKATTVNVSKFLKMMFQCFEPNNILKTYQY